MTIDS